MNNATEHTAPDGWRDITLGDTLVLLGGGTPKTSQPIYWNGDIPWLSVVDFNNDERWVSETEKSITQKGVDESATQVLNGGDLILSARGTVGALAQLTKPMAFNQSCYGIRGVDGVSDINFLFYKLRNELRSLQKNVHGAVFDTITRDTFDNIQTLLPKLPEQKAIADVLSSFDDKIELLREQNKTLEAMAQTLFKHWFVDFEFPNNDGKPYKSSGGKMIDSELGEIPEGWRVGTVDDEFKITMGQSPKGDTYNENGVGTLFFQGRAEFGSRFPKARLYTTEPQRMAEQFDVLLSVRAPVGDINVASEDCCIGRGLASINSNYKSYALYKIKSLKTWFDMFENEGTVFGSMSGTTFKEINVVIPVEQVIRGFDTFVSQTDAKIFNNHEQIQTLAKARNTLLPKLMRGEVRVCM